MDDTVYVFRVAAVNKDGVMDRPAIGHDPTRYKHGRSRLVGPGSCNTTEAAKPSAVEGLTSEESAPLTRGVSPATGVNATLEPAQRRDQKSTRLPTLRSRTKEAADWANPRPR